MMILCSSSVCLRDMGVLKSSQMLPFETAKATLPLSVLPLWLECPQFGEIFEKVFRRRCMPEVLCQWHLMPLWPWKGGVLRHHHAFTCQRTHWRSSLYCSEWRSDCPPAWDTRVLDDCSCDHGALYFPNLLTPFAPWYDWILRNVLHPSTWTDSLWCAVSSVHIKFHDVPDAGYLSSNEVQQFTRRDLHPRPISCQKILQAWWTGTTFIADGWLWTGDSGIPTELCLLLTGKSPLPLSRRAHMWEDRQSHRHLLWIIPGTSTFHPSDSYTVTICRLFR